MPEIVIPLTIRDLTPEDLPSCAWSGTATHLASIARALERARLGEVEYLTVCPPAGLPVALGGIDYAKTPSAGTLWQLAVTDSATLPMAVNPTRGTRRPPMEPSPATTRC